MRNKLLHCTAVVVLVWLLASGCSKKEQTQSSGDSSGSANKQAPNPKTEVTFTPKSPNAKVPLGSPEHSFTATDWFAECKKDFAGATNKYRGKVIELTGVVAGFEESFGNIELRLQVDGNNLDQVRCFTVDTIPWLKVSPGAKIKVKGTLPEVVTAGVLGHVEILDPGVYTSKSMTSEQLVKDHIAKRKETEDKLKNQWVNLEGVIAKKNKPDGTEISLRGEQDVTVHCLFAGFGKNAALEALKEGAKVKLFGRLVWDMNDKVIHLVDAMLTEPR